MNTRGGEEGALTARPAYCMQTHASWAAPLPDLPLRLPATPRLPRRSLNNRPLEIGTTTTNRGSIVKFVSKIVAISGKVRRWAGAGAGAALCNASIVWLLQLLLPRPVCVSSVFSHITPPWPPSPSPPPPPPTLQEVTLERTLPFAVRPEFSPRVLPRLSKVFESGVEGLTFAFKWDVYKTHHYVSSAAAAAEGRCPLLPPAVCWSGAGSTAWFLPSCDSKQIAHHHSPHTACCCWAAAPCPLPPPPTPSPPPPPPTHTHTRSTTTFSHSPSSFPPAPPTPTPPPLQEDGYNAIQFKEVYDCWARDIEIINPDNGIFIHSEGQN